MIALRNLLLAAILASALPAFAQTPQDHEAHHPDSAAGAQPRPAEPAPPAGGMTGSGMMGEGMMGGGMMMGQGEMGSDMMPMVNMMMRRRAGPEHIEGRLAYIKAELKITDAQTPQWNAFADATRDNAKAMREMRDAMMSRQGGVGTLPDRLALEDKAVTAHLAALKKIEDAASKLYGALTDDQKKLADGIIVGPMGMPMGMM